MKLFRKNMEKRCAYCVHGSAINDREVVCERRGVMNTTDHCRAFRYDPLKRVPTRPAVLGSEKYKAEDFKL